MRFVYKALMFGFILTSCQSLADESTNSSLLKAFHKYGITKCDDFIIQNSSLKHNWHFFISQHKQDIDKEIKEASVIQIHGTKNDTIKTDDSYIQTPEACYLNARFTLTYSGPCSSSIDLDHWYVSEAMPNNDYTEYKNKYGVSLFAKEITVGNFKACIYEYNRRIRHDIK